MVPGVTIRRVLPTLMSLAWLGAGVVEAQVSSQRVLEAERESQDWLTYSGSYSSARHSTLDQITPFNVDNLEQQWVYQAQVFGPWQATPLVVDGVMYVTQRPNDVVALDARTGRAFWIYRYPTPPDQKACCGSNNRGLAVMNDKLFMATLDAHLVAIDLTTGGEIWNVSVADMEAAYAFTLAPLAVKDKVIVGTSGGDYGIRGFIAAFDVETGEETWRFYTIPGPGEPGHETWEPCPPSSGEFCDPDAWQHGGGAVWVTGSYDPELNLTYWGVGNPGPDFNKNQRPGDNLYSDSVVALDVDTGELKWYFQFTPDDPYDYDAVQIPVLVDVERNGNQFKLMLWGNRNGFFYILDRETGRFLSGQPFVEVNWAEGLDDSGRPIETPQPPGAPTFPGVQGGTNWYSPSYSPSTELFYVPAWEDYGSVFSGAAQEYTEGRSFVGGSPTSFAPIPDAPTVPGLTRGPLNTWTEAAGHGAVIALDAFTGEPRWKFEMTDVTSSGILTTASDLLFTGSREGYFQALDARTGELLWKASLGGQIANGPITYEVAGRQYVATISGHSLVAFALGD